MFLDNLKYQFSVFKSKNLVWTYVKIYIYSFFFERLYFRNYIIKKKKKIFFDNCTKMHRLFIARTKKILCIILNGCMNG